GLTLDAVRLKRPSQKAHWPMGPRLRFPLLTALVGHRLPSRMRKPLQARTIAICFGIAVALLSWISAVSYRNTQQLVRSLDAVTQTHEVLDKLQHMETLMEAAESSVRGYILTGDTRRLESYRY